MNLHRKVEVKKKGVLWKPCVFMGCDFPRVLFQCREVARVFLDPQDKWEIYMMALFSYRGPYRWCRRKHLPHQESILYTKGLKETLADTAYQYSALDVYADRYPKEPMFPLDYLAVYMKHPALEYLTKLGMSGMVEELMRNPGTERLLRSGVSLRDVLEIQTPRELELARCNLLGLSEFKRAQKLLREGIELTDQEMADYMHLYSETFFAEYNTLLPVRKLAVYLAKQVEKEGNHPGCKLGQDLGMIDTCTKKAHQAMFYLWKDYIRFCRELRYELSATRILCPPDLKQEHDRIYKKYQDMQDKKKQAEQSRKDRRLRRVLRKEQCILSGKIQNKEYELVVPKSAHDIRREGSIQGHCVASYIDNILNGGCQIYFIRKRSEPEVPFYTVEWKSNRIVQCRGKGNCACGNEVGRFVKYAEQKIRRLKEASAKAA